MAEITIENPNFKLKDFIKVLRKRIHKEDWAIVPDAEDIDDRKFTIAIMKAGDIVIISGVHEISPDFNRIKIFILVDLKGIKVATTVIDVSTKVLTAVGVLATGSMGIALAAGKFAFSKLLNYQKKKRLEGTWKKIIENVIEDDLEYEGKVIEDFYLGLPPVDDEDRVLWNDTYKTYLDIVEVKIRRKLHSSFQLGYNEFRVFRDKLFRDGTVDIMGYALKVEKKKKIKEALVVFVMTNRKMDMQPFTVSEVAQMVNRMDAFAQEKFGKDGGVVRTFCVFVSATEPAYDYKMDDFLIHNYHVFGAQDNKIPLIFVIPPVKTSARKPEPETQEKGIFGKVLSIGKEILSSTAAKITEKELWHNIYIPESSGMLASILNMVPFSHIVSMPIAGKDEILKHKLKKMSPKEYRQLIDQFLFEWSEILIPENAKMYLDLQKFIYAKNKLDTELSAVQ